MKPSDGLIIILITVTLGLISMFITDYITKRKMRNKERQEYEAKWDKWTEKMMNRTPEEVEKSLEDFWRKSFKYRKPYCRKCDGRVGCPNIKAHKEMFFSDTEDGKKRLEKCPVHIDMNGDKFGGAIIYG